MIFRASILLLLVSVLLINAEEVCDKSKIYNALRDMRNKLQITKASNYSEAFNLYNAMISFEDAGEAFASQSKLCPESDIKEFKAMLQLAFAIATKNMEKVQNTLTVIENQNLLDEFAGLLYAVDKEIVVPFLANAPVDVNTRMSKTYINLLKRTNLNNTEIITRVDEIRELKKALTEVNDETKSKNLKNLLHEMIKADLMLQHDNIEELYKIDKEITKDVILELITYYVTYEIETHQQLALFPLLLIIKCPSNTDIWIDNLNLLFETIKSNNKMNSIQTLFLLKEVEALLELSEENKILLDIQAQIPDVMKTILNGNVCVKAQEINKPINMFLIDAESGRLNIMKLTPAEDGAFATITGAAGGFNFTLVVNVIEGLDDVFKDLIVAKHVGNLDVLSVPEFCVKNDDIVLHACVPFAKLLPSGLAKPQNLGIIRQLSRNINMILQDSITESCDSENTTT